MAKGKKIAFTVVAILLVIALVAFIGVYFLFLHHYKGKDIINVWSATDEFKIEDIATVNKKEGKDFVVLNLADVQTCDLEDVFNFPVIRKEIDFLVKTVQPDLITLTGDQTWSNENLLSLTSLIGWLDSYKIPYAPVFGNHDYGNEKDSAVLSCKACCDLYENGKYSLFSRGPSNLGSLGNYVINVMEGDKIFKTLYMLDSGYTEMISDEQIAWFKWNAEGIKQANAGEYSEGMCFMHKPLPEFTSAYKGYVYGDVESLGEVYVNYSLSGSRQNGFFAEAKERNVTDVVCGHQHGNCFSLKYEGVRLTSVLKTGELGGYSVDGTVTLNGATYFTLNGDGTSINNLFVDADRFHIRH